MSATVPLSDLLFPLIERKPAAVLPDPQTVEPSAVREDVARLRASLVAKVGAKVTSATELIKALEKTRREESIPTTLEPFDALLGGGLPRGKMVELTGRRGRYSIAMSALAAATSMGEAAVLIDLGDGFDPQLAEANGIDLRRLLWIRPKTLKQAVMAVEMITATGFQLVALDCGTRPGRRVHEAAWVRLGRSAEAHGAAMLISTPWPLTGTASEAVVVADRTRMQWLGRGKAPRVLAGMTVELRLEKHRHMKPGTRTTVTFTTVDAIRTSLPDVTQASVASPQCSTIAALAAALPSAIRDLPSASSK